MLLTISSIVLWLACAYLAAVALTIFWGASDPDDPDLFFAAVLACASGFSGYYAWGLW